ncbi:MAG: argininosuccinate lyase [Candidatus Micrarchaeota archaeon]
MKLWQKTGKKLDLDVERYTIGDDYLLDLELVPFDVRASKAHARMLCSKGYLSKAELSRIVSALDDILNLHSKGKFEILSRDEDCHTAIENYLVKKLGEAGKKIHTARSRNDQSMTALRLLYKERMKGIINELGALRKTLGSAAKKAKGLPMPGYTHTRRAMPTTVGEFLLAYEGMLADDLAMAQFALAVIDKSPLGSAAGFGVPLKIDRDMTARELGFKCVQENPIHCANSRGKYESLVVAALLSVMQSLNRMASDLILFTAPEFGFFKLPDSLCTGSSIMPQKRNPDVLELVRANAHVVHGSLVTINGIIMDVPSGYNRDYQLTKGPALKSLRITVDSVRVMGKVLSALKPDRKRLEASMAPELFATEKAYKLVGKGMPFREAYRKVASELMEE